MLICTKMYSFSFTSSVCCVSCQLQKLSEKATGQPLLVQSCIATFETSIPKGNQRYNSEQHQNTNQHLDANYFCISFAEMSANRTGMVWQQIVKSCFKSWTMKESYLSFIGYTKFIISYEMSMSLYMSGCLDTIICVGRKK